MILEGYTQRTVEPYTEPVSLAQAKRQLRVDTTDDDTLITSLIVAARQFVENACSVCLVASTYQQMNDGFPCVSLFQLNYPPLRSVTSIQYIDTAGTTQTLSTSKYTVDNGVLPGQVYLSYAQVWPATRCIPNSVLINFQAGYALPFTAAVDDTITFQGYTPTNGDRFRLSSTEGTFPGGLDGTTDYYVINASGSTCKFSTSSGGSAVNVTSTGSGTFFAGAVPQAAIQAILMLVGWMYENRTPSIDQNSVPPHIGWLLSNVRWGAY